MWIRCSAHLLFCLGFFQFDPLYLPATTASVAAVGAAAGAWSGGWFAWLCVLGKIGVYTGLLLIVVLICSNPGMLPKRPKGDSSVEELMDVSLPQELACCTFPVAVSVRKQTPGHQQMHCFCLMICGLTPS